MTVGDDHKCPVCGEVMKSATFYLHPDQAIELDRLVQLRKASGDEEDLNQVLNRLIHRESNRLSKKVAKKLKKARRTPNEKHGCPKPMKYF